MIRKLALTLAFMLLPAAAMAQEHKPHHPAGHGTAAAAGEHKDFALQLIEKRAELKLTDAQVEKLRALSAEMAEHHKKMSADHAAMDAEHRVEMEEKMHAKLRAVFDQNQIKTVHELMVKHHAEMACMHNEDGKCKVPTRE
jgi:hypothetical protein